LRETFFYAKQKKEKKFGYQHSIFSTWREKINHAKAQSRKAFIVFNKAPFAYPLQNADFYKK